MKKYIINFSEDSNKTIVTRYLKENFLMKSKFFILLYSIYLIYVRVHIYKFNLDISLMKKVSLETSFHFLVLYFIILLVKSKEIMILEKEEIIIKKFFTFICYQTNKIKVSDIRSIYYETNSLTGKFNIFVDMTKNLKIRTKFKEYEDKIYYFGINLSEEEYKEIIYKILEYNGALNILQGEWRKICEKLNTIRWFIMVSSKEKLIEFGNEIKEIINLWDPLKIMDISFSNEYSYEINRIIEELSKNISAQDLAKKINKIFKNTYNELYEIEKNEEIKIARKILKAYNIEEGRGIW